MQDSILECVGEEKTAFIDATGSVEQLIGGNMAANIFLAGYAWQKGLIPISLPAIEQAIELNGAAVDDNQRAFSLGRLLAHNPDAFSLEKDSFEPLTDLEEIVADRKAFLTDYQDSRYADRYEALVHRVQQSTGNEKLSVAVARNYFKLLAFKDEYEVARLYTDGNFMKRLDKQFEGDYKLRFHLAPPLFAPTDPHTGLPRKITFGQWMLPVFRILAKFRFLRGSRLDPFAWSKDRRLERRLIGEYEQLIEHCLPLVDDANIDVMERLMRLPERIRGYGHIKERNAQLAEVEKRRLLASIDAKQPQPVRIQDPQAA
ncbi:MAG: hypothetical protein HUJ31_08135 [Pseudomonadales bacterium]|nr:hypothetical protein [Pseudomonadales bacterium]